MYLECGSGECSACVAEDAVEDEACELIEDAITKARETKVVIISVNSCICAHTIFVHSWIAKLLVED